MRKTMIVMWLLVLSSLSAGSRVVTASSTENAPSSNWGSVANEAYWYSRYYLGNLEMRSGAGLHMVFSPTFQGNMKMMMTKIAMGANVTHATPPPNAFPIFAEFGAATPQYAQDVDVNNPGDFATLRWDLSTADKDLYPAALAQAGMKNILWSEDFFGANHFVDTGDSTDDAVNSLQNARTGTVALGEGKTTSDDYTTEGFRGFVLTAEVINKMKFLKRVLAVNIATGEMDGNLNPATNAGSYYFPHRYTYETAMVTPQGAPGAVPKPGNYSIVDADSMLWDQLSLLWMAAKFFAWSAAPDQDDVFGGDGNGAQPFPGPMAETSVPGPEDLAKGLANTVWMSMTKNHWDSSAKTFVDSASYSSGKLTMGSSVTTAIVAKTLISLEQWSKATGDGMNQKQYASDQADFLISKLQGQDGGFENSYDLGGGTPSSGSRTLETQTSAIRGLVTAYDLTGDVRYKRAALDAFDYMERKLWDDSTNVYRSSEGALKQTYTTAAVASTVGGLRSIMALGDERASPLAHYRLLQFFENAVDKSGFQQSEIAPTGAGSDGDTIPPPPMQKANGAIYGTAPMPVGEIQLSGDSWSITDYTFYTDTGMYAANEFFLTGTTGHFIKTYSPPSESYKEAVNNYYKSSSSSTAPLEIGIFGIIGIGILLVVRRRKIIE